MNRTLMLFEYALAASVILFALSLFRSLRPLRYLAVGFLLSFACSCGFFYMTRPSWLTEAGQELRATTAMETPTWVVHEPGFETTVVEVVSNGEIVDKMHLIRLEPKRFRFQVLNDPRPRYNAEEWRDALKASVVINGSYFIPGGTPDTPLISDGKILGPKTYNAEHGALVAGPDLEILDLKGRDLSIIKKYRNAMVSYPLLLDEAGNVRAAENPGWLASRTFVAFDRNGKFLIGTTETGYFSLYRLGHYLKSSPLNLRIALNLDGGPISAQAVQIGNFRKAVYGTAEVTDPTDLLRLQHQKQRKERWKLPIIFAVYKDRTLGSDGSPDFAPHKNG
jgi:hypothetical protein